MSTRLALMLLLSSGVHAAALWLGDARHAPRAPPRAQGMAVSLAAAPAREVLAAVAPAPVAPVAAEPVTAIAAEPVTAIAAEPMASVTPALAVPPLAAQPISPARADARHAAPARVARVATVPSRTSPTVSGLDATPHAPDAVLAAASRSAGGADHDAVPMAGNRPPRYPWTARLRGEQGQVVLRVWVDEAGGASRLDVWQSSGSRALDQAALAAVASWRFEPARRNGRNAHSLLHVPVRFRLDGDG